MEKTDIITIAKILLLGGIILCGIAQIVPWGEIASQGEFPYNYGTGFFYSWGGHTPLSEDSSVQWVPYVLFPFDTDFEYFYYEHEFSDYPIQILLSILILPLCLISLIIGIYVVIKLKKSKSTTPGHTGIFSIFAVVCFFIFFQFSMVPINEYYSRSWSYSAGFYVMICSSIMFFVSYLLIEKYNKDQQKIKEEKRRVRTEKKKQEVKRKKVEQIKEKTQKWKEEGYNVKEIEEMIDEIR